MATIHRARDTRLDRDVAVKLLRPEIVADADLAQRFRREALAATVLRHRNIVACLDTGTDGDQPYLVMELVDGEDLAARLRRGRRLAPAVASRIALDVARALGVAHIRGIVHRDVKPGNILLAADGHAMVTDFGIARLAMDAEAVMPGTTLGSVQYFSPEQARGRTTTPASDVYGLGLVLYETLSGRRAWSGDSTDALALARVGAPAPSARDVRPEVPEALDAIVRRALAPEPEDRYPNGVAMAAALEPVVIELLRSDAMVLVDEPAAADEPTADPAEPLAAPLRPPSVGAAVAASAPAPSSSAPPVRGRSVIRQPRPRGGSPVRRGLTLAGAAAMVVGLVLIALPMVDGGTAGLEPRSSPIALGPTPDPTAAASDPPASSGPSEAPTEEPAATPDPGPTARPAVDGADLCEPLLDLPCGLDAGRYAPARFDPPFALTIEDGWSTSTYRPNVVVLSRPQGFFSFISGVRTIDPEGAAREAGAKARPFIESIVTMDGLAATKPARVRIDKRRGFSTDVSPTGSERRALLATDEVTYYIEPDRTTRVVAMAVGKSLVVIVIEPGDDADLEGILDTADVAAGTIDWP
jgi:serine/threonine-protein kinase